MKLTRYNGHVPLFSQNMEGRERTLFGSTVQDDDINNQFTPEFLRGWGSVGSTEFPTLQDFNALAYTHNKLLSYLYQAGIPSYSKNEEYYIGSIVQYNKDIYICLRDKPTVLPTDTNAWKRVQESLTFVGNGSAVKETGAKESYLKNTGVYYRDMNPPPKLRRGMSGLSSSVFFDVNNPELGLGSKIVGQLLYFEVQASYSSQEDYAIFREARGHRSFTATKRDDSTGWTNLTEIITDRNTRTDANNVLHAGTSTPINTLNVSDMSQEVINNDLLTVTSGAVYRALLEKADSTYVNTELNKKANLTYVNSELLKKADKTYVDSELLKKADLTYVNTELDKKITGGNVVQTTGQSTVDVMSQKAYTDLTFGIGQSWVDVTRDRIVGSTYTNATTKPIEVFITFDPDGNKDHFFIDEISMMSIYDVNVEAISLTIPPGSTYRLATTGGIIKTKWMELR